LIFINIALWPVAPGFLSAHSSPNEVNSKETVTEQTPSPARGVEIKTKALDRAGENIGKGIDKLSRTASSSEEIGYVVDCVEW